MANIREAMQYAAQNPESDFANNLKSLIKSGSLNQEAQKYGIDLSPFQEKNTKPSYRSEENAPKTNVDKIMSGLNDFTGAGDLGAKAGQYALKKLSKTFPEDKILENAAKSGDTIAPTGKQTTAAGLKAVSTLAIPFTGGASKLGQVAVLGGSGYAQDVANNLEEGAEGVNVLTPGIGAVIGAAVPVARIIPEASSLVNKGAKKTANLLKEGVSPTPTVEKALGEVSLAKTQEQLPTFKKALSGIDTSKIKTFSDLNNAFKSAIPNLAKQVDNELLKDTGLYKIDDLLLGQETKSGKIIKTDYITRAMDGLDDLYTKLGDDVAKADLNELKNKALSQGLTRKEVNDLARTYNTEFAEKAFTATGDIKSGISAEMYESTRKGLKDIARAGIGGKEAKEMDSVLSSIYEAQKLTEKNRNAVQAIKQRIEEQGWVGKGIRGAFNISDLVTGGAVRALRDTVLARGNAQKLQNVLELENKLKKNLEVLTKASKAKTEKTAEKILQGLSKE